MKVAPVVLSLLFAASLTAQVVVRRPGNSAADTLRATIARLVDGQNSVEAHTLLLRTGAAAVSLLAAEVERNGPAAEAALFVLVELGCDAAPAVPVLRRVALAEATTADRRADLLRAIAAIDGPPMLLVPVYQQDAVVELDLDGNERRKVACENPWGVWPVDGDGIGALCYGHGRIEHRAWDGKELARRDVSATTAWCFEVGVGDLICGDYDGKGRIARLGPKDEERWRMECSAIRVIPLADGRLMVIDQQAHQLSIYTAARCDVTIKVDDSCIGARPLPGGGFLLMVDEKVVEIDAKGEQVRDWAIGERVHDARLLRDGRLAVTTNQSVKMLGVDGKVLWERSYQMAGPFFVREPAAGGR